MKIHTTHRSGPVDSIRCNSYKGLVPFPFVDFSYIYGFNLGVYIEDLYEEQIEPIGHINGIVRNVTTARYVMPVEFATANWGSSGYYHLYRSSSYTRSFYSVDGILRGNKYLGTLELLGATPSKILYALCIKQEYLEYVYQCLLLNRDVDPRVLVFLIDQEFDCPKSYAPRCRPAFRKYVKKTYLEENIEIQMVPDLMSQLITKFEFSSKTIPDLKLESQKLINELLTSTNPLLCDQLS